MSDSGTSRRRLLQGVATTGAGSVLGGRVLGTVAAADRQPVVELEDPGTRRQRDSNTVVDFDWEYPRCPDRGITNLNSYFFGDVGDRNDEFHVDGGSGADDDPDGCVLRSDADDAGISSLPEEHSRQPDTLAHYPGRGETITFTHYAHREGSNMEFQFGVQEDVESHYAVRLETEDGVALYLLRADGGDPTVLDQATDLSYTTGEFHRFEIEWDEDIAVTLYQNGMGTTLSGNDGTYDRGGIGFRKENSGFLYYTHFWNAVEAHPL